MTYLLDADTLIFMIRGLKSSNRHQASRDRAQKLVGRCRQAQAVVVSARVRSAAERSSRL